MIENISAYVFTALGDLEGLRETLLPYGQADRLLGTILLSPEGINLNLAGTPEAIAEIKTVLQQWPGLEKLTFKTSYSEDIPFQRYLVKIKPEIITYRRPEIAPEKETVPHLAPETLKQWLDEGRDVVLLDTRNQFELGYGKFTAAVDCEIEQFTEFAATQDGLPEDKEQPVVMYCTGGVRCEKAGPAMTRLGYKNVYQLDGGILNYFEKCGAAHYTGACFVFDERITVTPEDCRG